MIEKEVLSYLKSKGFTVFMEMPKNTVKPFLLVEKTGSGRVNYLDSALIAIQSYAPRLAQAADLNERAIKAMMSMPDASPAICSVKRNSDYNFSDTENKIYRYQAVFDIYYYGG